MLLPRLLRGSLPNTTRAFRQIQLKDVPIKVQSTRCFSTSWQLREQLTLDDTKHLPDMDPSKLEVTKSITPKQLVPNQDLVFGRTFTG